MKRILVIGATGNIGQEVIKHLSLLNEDMEIIAGVRDIEQSKSQFAEYNHVKFARFDFNDAETFKAASNDIDVVFLLRPPHIADVNKYFKPLLDAFQANGVGKIVFLSVQGAEKSRVIPHHKIEKLIRFMQFDFVFLRPSYFMQNLTTTLLTDIQKESRIVLPAGKAVFNWVDGSNVGEVAANVLVDFDLYNNKAFEVTGYENKDFYTVIEEMNQALGTDIHYKSVNPLVFYRYKKKQGYRRGMILVMMFLHLIPRFQKAPAISQFYESVTGKKPTSVQAFIEREKSVFLSH